MIVKETMFGSASFIVDQHRQGRAGLVLGRRSRARPTESAFSSHDIEPYPTPWSAQAMIVA
jgi:hypothetical protein